MAVTVVESACTVAQDGLSARIVLESDETALQLAIEELKEPEPRRMAINYARQLHVNDPRIGGSSQQPYAINSDGIPLDEVRNRDGSAVAGTDPRMAAKKFRISIPISAKLT